MTATCVLIAFAAMCIATTAGADACLSIVGNCFMGGCPNGSSCIDNICCITDAAENCDNALGDQFCVPNAAKCTDATMKDSMSKQCAKTCKTCDQQSGSTTGGDCVDKTTDCVKDAYLCNNKIYYDLMTEKCPKTCNRCSGAAASPPASPPASKPCVDKTKPDGTSDCAKDAYLCNNSAYYDLMTQQCPKTCGRC
uniref:ShTK domain protein n=1 Tax=Panagrellus redivivus TaxID=6233 RepID=A0A7E4VAE1_PANRE